MTARMRSKATAPRPEPERPVGADERDHGVGQRDRSEAVEHRGEDVQHQEDECQQRDVAVQRVDQEARPARRCSSAARRGRRARSRAVRSSSATAPWSGSDTSRCCRPRGQREAHAAVLLVCSPGSGHPPRACTASTLVDQPRGQPESGQPCGGCLGADDRGGGGDVRVGAGVGGDADGPPGALAGAPVSGSMMWCIVLPP